MKGWECPKCGYCYSYMVRECGNCNKPKGDFTGGMQDYPLYVNSVNETKKDKEDA